MKATEAVKKMVAKTNRYLGVSTTTEKPGALGVREFDWERVTGVAAGLQGESWCRITIIG